MQSIAPNLLTTERLILRQWQDADRNVFARLNADPVVREFFPGVQTREESDADAGRIHKAIEERGWGFWAVEVRGGASFIGFVGLSRPGFEAHFTSPKAPCVEIGWRLAQEHWRNGYASEAANACLRFGFEKLTLQEIVAFTVPSNERSRAVMTRIGMSRDPADDFDHPNLEPGHPLRRHVLYRISRSGWGVCSLRRLVCDAPVT
jgi:RimJ/RimL family protein N-acetyltransferase